MGDVLASYGEKGQVGYHPENLKVAGGKDGATVMQVGLTCQPRFMQTNEGTFVQVAWQIGHQPCENWVQGWCELDFGFGYSNLAQEIRI